MQKLSLEALARGLLERAATTTEGRAAQTVMGGHERVLRQTVIGMARGIKLAEHANPGEASVFVLRGRRGWPLVTSPGRASTVTCSWSPIPRTASRR